MSRSYSCHTTTPCQLTRAKAFEPLHLPIMDNDTDATLQHYARGIYSILADIVMTTFLFGCLTVLSIISAYHLIRRGIKDFSTVFMLGSIFILYASTATDFAVKTMYVVEHGRLLNAAVAALETTSSSSTDAALSRFGQRARTISYIISGLYAINITLGDAIVWWRVWVLWRKKSIIMLGLVLILGTFVVGTVSTVHFQVDVKVQPLLSYGDIYGGISGLLTSISNVIATSLIGRKAWEHRKVLRQGPGASRGRWKTPTMKVLVLLIESGTIYSAIFCVAVINNIMMRFESKLAPSALEFLSLSTVFFTGCFVPMLAIYPTLIICIVALNRSEMDSALAVATPSDIPTNMLPSMLLRGSNTSIHLSPSIDRPLQVECGFYSVEDPSGEEGSRVPEGFKRNQSSSSCLV
ncbi:hypothetical protein V8D89_007529 [Ganoderma adspersum]